LLSDFQFHPRMQNISDEGEEPDIMQRQSSDSLSSPGKARVKTKNSEVKLTWRNALEMEVTLANGTEETIHLRGVPDLEGGEVPCLYTGSLDHDSEDSEVTVDGCKGDPQVLVEIASRKEVGGLLVLVIEREKTYQLQREKTHWNRNDSNQILPKDSPTSNFEDYSLPASRRGGRLPREVTLRSWLVFDKSLLSKFNNNKRRVRNHLIRLAQMTKPILRRLDVRVNLEVRGVRHRRSAIDTSQRSERRIFEYLRGKNWGLVSYFTARKSGWTTGRVPKIGRACDTRSGLQFNINWVEDNNYETALTFAHELGHNLGIRHDFDKDHGGKRGHCNGEKGVMSYGIHPDTWTRCSNKDFSNWYQRVGYRCL